MNLKRFAEEIGVSQPTVSKVLNNCFGVDGRTRAYVREEARKRGLLPEDGRTDVFCILPSAPTYFWRPVFENLYRAARSEEYRAKFNVYSRLVDEDAVLAYLEQARALDARALVVAALITPRVKAVLEELATDRLVILLNQYADVRNVFYVGEDGGASGRALGEECRELFGRCPRIIHLSTGDNGNAHRRNTGFWEIAAHYGAVSAGRISLYATEQILASRLARELSAMAGQFDGIYCDDGILSHAALAAEKLRTGRLLPCIGYECPGGGRKYRESGAIAAYVFQDHVAQGEKVMELVYTYLQTDAFPAQKYNYVPSRTWIHPRYKARDKEM